MLSILVPARFRQLTTLEAVRSELKLTSMDDDLLLERYILEASASIEQLCDRIFARQKYLETARAYGDQWLTLAQIPVVEVETIYFKGDPVIGWELQDGQLFRRSGWAWTAVRGGWHDALEDAWIPGTEAFDFAVTYLAGYLVPNDDIEAETITFSAIDNSLNDIADQFPPITEGEYVTVIGSSANSGKLRVLSRTPSKLIIDPEQFTITGELPGPPINLRFCNLPHGIEEACISIACDKYRGYQAGGEIAGGAGVKSETIGDLRVTYATTSASTYYLPPRAVSLLQSYMRTKI